jgi:AraC-like DNA-binding protein
MRTEMRSSIYKEDIMVIEDPIVFNTQEIIEKKIDIDRKGIKGSLTEISLNGVQLEFKDLTIERDSYSVEIEHDFSFIKLHFEIEGDNRYCPENAAESTIYIPEGHYNLFYLPVIKGTLHFHTHRRKTLEITFTELYLQQLFYPNLDVAIPQLADAIRNKIEYKMWDASKVISPKLHEIIEGIMLCNYTGAIKKAFLESKVVEILSHLFTIINEEENTKISEDVNANDYLKIVAVEKILKTQFKEKHTLASISAEVGLNDFKLKKQFKMVFNTTVFNYLTQVRMDYAKQLIAEKDCSISSVSEELGYKNPQHFTVAFKKTFGYLPSKLKKES